MFFLLLYIFFATSKNINDTPNNYLDSFSFTTSRRKEYTLVNATNYINQKRNSFMSFMKNIFQSNEEIHQKEWYYVHVQNNALSKVKKYIQLQSCDEIIKNTFILYLSQIQLSQIAEYSQIKKIEPNEKIDEIYPFKDTDYLYVKTTQDYNLPLNPDLYSIWKKNSRDSYILKIDQNRLNKVEFIQKKKEAARYLSRISAIKTVSTYKKPVKQNNINVGLIQKYQQPLMRDKFTSLYKYDRYVHNHGLTGQNQIITIEDTPIDFRHPMFKDEKNQVEFNKEMKNHRKFVYYYSETDLEGWKSLMKENDHGTHVAGTLAGKSMIEQGSDYMSQLFDGSAPDAKLVYVGVYGNVSAVELEERMNKFNSRISSNSWGDDELYVDSLNHEYGSLAYRNPQSLFVFAAGNHGFYGNFSIVDPSGSKNVLSVSYFNNPVFQYTNQYTLQSMVNHDLITSVYSEFMFNNLIATADFLGTEIGDSKIIAVDARKDSCEKIIGNHISVLYGGNFELLKAFINECFIDESSGLVLTENTSAVEELIKLHSKVGIIFNTVINETIPFQRGGYSSAGPANKGIIKPDVIAPGELIVSAKSYKGSEIYTCEDISTGCGISLKSGSSMATPNVAGAAALVSQYFKEGKWTDKTDLDGSTLRALIINSCYHPLHSKKVDIFLGHGIVDISTILPFDGDFGVQITSQNEKPFVLENGHVSAKIEVKSKRVKLQVTLSYIDTMLNENSPIPLTRDLDLFVISPDGKMFVGDDVFSDTQHLSTNEKVIINEQEIVPGIYTIHIFGNSFFDSSLNEPGKNKQEFAVVATGDIENKYISFEESDDVICKGTELNKQNSCSCNEDEIGPTCQTKIHLVKEVKDNLTKINVESMQIYRIKFSLNKKIESLITNCDSCIHDYYKYATIWTSTDCHLTLGEYDTNFKIDTNDTKISVGSNEICVAIFNFNDRKSSYQIEVITDDSNSDNDDNNDNDDNEKLLFSVLIGLICVLSVAFVCLVIVIIFIIVKTKKEKNEAVESLDQISDNSNLI